MAQIYWVIGTNVRHSFLLVISPNAWLQALILVLQKQISFLNDSGHVGMSICHDLAEETFERAAGSNAAPAAACRTLPVRVSPSRSMH